MSFSEEKQSENNILRKSAIYAFTPQGMALALRLSEQTGAIVYAVESLKTPSLPPNGKILFFSALPEQMSRVFTVHPAHIFISAAAIAVRAIAPRLVSKMNDPAVLVIDQQARHVISLLSGHTGGANRLALRLAHLTGAAPVITTATDLERLPAVDMLAKEYGLGIANPGMIKEVSAALLRGERPLLYAPAPFLTKSKDAWDGYFKTIPLVDGQTEYSRLLEHRENTPSTAVIITEYQLPEKIHEHSLILHPRTLCAGIGCKKNSSASAIAAFVRATFTRYRLSIHSLAYVASISAKRNERGLLLAADALGCPLLFFNSEELNRYPVHSPSPKAMATFGVLGVAEPAALAAAEKNTGHPGTLIVPKCKTEGVTLALARANGDLYDF